MRDAARPFGWLQIFRLGLVQACLGAVVITTTSTLKDRKSVV
jgi:BCD family chlorophyll transporter-like MFS transporter